MKNFIYLVQGEAKSIDQYLHLSERDNADAIFLTYDKPIDGAIFFPNSTWAQGRNKLMNYATEKGKYQYYIFCDDDISFRKGGWTEFENNLLKFQPAIGVPVFYNKTKNTPLPGLKLQTFLLNDEQMMAFHHDVVIDNLVLPYQTKFDKLHWWAACEIQEILIQNFYSKNAIQFNNIVVSNECRTRYPESDFGKEAFRSKVRVWLGQQFTGNSRDIIILLNKKDKILVILKTIMFCLRRFLSLRKIENHLDKDNAQKLLYPNCFLWKQMNWGKSYPKNIP